MAFGADTAKKEPIPAPALDETHKAAGHTETAVFAGGCFWGVQTTFQRIKGVKETYAGYSGGTAATANYGDVSSETTKHAESVKVVYDPTRISYGTLLRVFFSVVHDPTQLNRQGPDVGYSYRSVIFFTTPEQQKIAEAYIAQLDAAHVFPKKIVTQLVPLEAFYNAEDYHQDYAEKNPNNPYIQICDVPKVAALKQQFPELFQDFKDRYK
ncbi:MAG TPA: peptide-methionine (S)-S-oxide reductase MsrA [Granulicella sp.]